MIAVFKNVAFMVVCMIGCALFALDWGVPDWYPQSAKSIAWPLLSVGIVFFATLAMMGHLRLRAEDKLKGTRRS